MVDTLDPEALDDEAKARAKTRLHGLVVNEVSAVDRAANDTKFLIIKDAGHGVNEIAPEPAHKSADDSDKGDTMAEPVSIFKERAELDRARRIMWAAMDKLEERLYPEDQVAAEAVLASVVSQVAGPVAMSDAEKAADDLATALAKALSDIDGEDATPLTKEALEELAKSATAAKAAVTSATEKAANDIEVAVAKATPAPPVEGEPTDAEKLEAAEKAGKRQLSIARAKQFRSSVAGMVKLLQEMDPTLEKESLWPAKAIKAAPPEDAQTDVEKRSAELEAELAALKAELAVAKRRPTAPNALPTEAPAPTADVSKTAPALNMMDLNV